MKKLMIFVTAALVFCSCHQITGSGNIITEKRNTGGFNAISASAGIGVVLKNGAMAIEVEADDNVIKYLETDVNDNTLRIHLKNGLSLSNTHLKVYVTAPSIKSLSASSGSGITVQDILTGNNSISLNSSSSGKIIVEVNAPYVSAEASSAGEINVTGRAKELKATVSSGGNLKAGELMTETTEVNASSGANARVRASVSLNANASSGGNINYRGIASVSANQSSGGTVSKGD